MSDHAHSNIRLVVFDIGRVLLRICDGWSDAAHRAGIEMQMPALDERQSAILHNALEQIDIGRLDLDSFIAVAGPLLGLTPSQLRATSDAYLISPYAGGVELIEDLHAAGVATACLSNTNESHWRIMNDPAEAAHLQLHRLTYRFASHLVGARKPDPAIYARVERETSVSPSQIIFFDDIAENIDGSRKRGWCAFPVDPRLDNPIPVMRAQLRSHGVLD